VDMTLAFVAASEGSWEPRRVGRQAFFLPIRLFMTIFYSFHFNALVYSDLHISLPLAILTVGHLSPPASVPVADTSRDLSMPAAGTSGAAHSFGLLVNSNVSTETEGRVCRCDKLAVFFLVWEVD